MKIFKLLIIFFLFTSSSFAQFGMPSFKETVTEFFTRYSYDSYESYLKFQRKKDGWFISQDSYDSPGNYFNTVQFWSLKNHSFMDVDYPMSNGDTALISESVNKYLEQIAWSYEEYSFQRNKYYGYPGWDWDIINEISDQNAEDDSLLESRARAYSNYASGFIVEQFGDLFVNDDPDRIAIKAQDKISKSRINKFIQYELKSIDAYKKIIAINPDYETRVGNVRIKCANEYLFMYCDLLMAGDLINAKRFLEKADYPDSLLKISKNYLNSVPRNGILITYGDNDTYPLLYLQEIQKYRSDVIVLNNSLLNLRRYLAMIDVKYHHSLFSIIDTSYLKKNFDYFFYSNNKETAKNLSIDVGTFLKDLNSDHNPYDTTINYARNEILKKYYSKNLFFMKNKSTRSKVLTLKNYLFMNDYIVLDIINTNRNRKVYFTFDNELLTGLLKKNGVVYELDL